MIDSIDTNAAAPAGDADFSSAAPLEAESSADSISATPTSSGLLGEDGSFVPEWYSRFEELKGTEKSLAKFKTPEALARSYTELERLRRYPGVDNEEQMARFRQMAGLPDSEEDYRLERPETMPEEEWNPELAERMARAAYRYGGSSGSHERPAGHDGAGLPGGQGKGAGTADGTGNPGGTVPAERMGRQLRAQHGRATAALQRLASETGVDADALLDNRALGSNPDVIRLLYQVSRLLDEAPLHQEGAAAPSPAEEAMRMESDPSHPLYEAYMSVNHPNHKYANELYDRLTSR